VFGTFAPRKDSHSILGVDYTGINSANFAGLSKLETNIRHLGPPKWPWAIDQSLANQGKAIFNLPTDQGGCVACHGIRPGITRFPNWKTWATPIQDVGTDSREYQILGWTADSGELTGASIPFLSPTPIKPVDSSLNILSISVFGAILENYLSFPILEQAQPQLLSVPPRFDDLKGDFQTGSTSAAYESRALEGIWAAAPYLHNGSVPTLAELLKPAHDRVYTFAIGPIYDKNNVGLARRQGQFSSTLHTTGCNDVSSGNSHCGHEYGTTLSEPDKRALLEYLKTL